MAKIKVHYICSNCGVESPQWLGKCPECSEWNSFIEEEKPLKKSIVAPISTKKGPSLLSDEDLNDDGERINTGIDELNRVLGSGLMKGSSVLIGGDPGIGKSTLMLQLSASLSDNNENVLYVTGEESLKQIKQRANRTASMSPTLLVWPETSLEKIVKKIKEEEYSVVVIDSVQTLYSSSLDSSPGSVTQLREVTGSLTSLAKQKEVSIFLVGHVTKEGVIAGPRVIEHMVDTVLYFEGERDAGLRILRANKNRYGSQMEIGIFEMTGSGLKEVLDPSSAFLRSSEYTSGMAVTPCIEGSRCMLVEIESLVTSTVFGMPRRLAIGLDINKVNLLSAVLEKKANISFSSDDIYLKVTGGLKIIEPSVDLALCLSLVSNKKDRVIKKETLVFGEIGLTGDVRAVTSAEKRVKEGKKLGFKRCILPMDNLNNMEKIKGIDLIGVKNIREAIDEAF